MRKTSFFAFFLFFLGVSVHAQPEIIWSVVYGGSGEDYSEHAHPTSDGGYFLPGNSWSDDGHVTGNHGFRDWWLVKLSAQGDLQWEKCMGGSEMEVLTDYLPLSDGGYLLLGESESNDGDVSGNHNPGEYDMWMVKTDSEGNIEWQKCTGGSSFECGNEILQEDDGGYIIAGHTDSQFINGQPTGIQGECDYWILKTDSLGDIVWQKFYGGSAQDLAKCIDHALDGGYIVSGSAMSDDGDVVGNHGSSDGWVLKLDSLGDIEWKNCFGGSSWDSFSTIEQTPDGGYLALGRTQSNDGDVSGNHGTQTWDIWMVKIDEDGNLEWEKCFGGSADEIAETIVQTIDGEYIIAGMASSTDGDVQNCHGGLDGWVFKIDDQNNIRWQRCLGGSATDGAEGIQEISPDEYIVSLWAASADGDLNVNYGDEDLWTVHLSCISGPLSIAITDSLYCDSTELSAIGNFEEYIWNTGDTTQSISIGTGGTYRVNAYTLDGCMATAEIIAPGPLQLIDGFEICLATFDDTAGMNMIIYEPITDIGIDTIIFYRHNESANEYERIGSNHISLDGIFIDQEADPEIQSYQYKIAVRNICGEIGNQSPMHKTMHLMGTVNQNNEVALTWNHYVGFNYVGFGIYRSLNGGDFELIMNTIDTTFTDQTPPGGQLQYQIRVEKEQVCNPGSISYSYTSSNTIVIQYVGVDERLMDVIKIYPNPFEDKLTISKPSSFGAVNIELIDILNRPVGTYLLTSDNNTISISTSHLSHGVYFIKLNNIAVRRIIKQ